AVDERARLARARAGDHQDRTVAMGYGGELRGIEQLGVLDAEAALVNFLARGAQYDHFVGHGVTILPHDLATARREVPGERSRQLGGLPNKRAVIESAPMAGLSQSRNVGALWVIGALLALSLAVVVPIHLSHPFLTASNAVHAGVRAAHHTVVDQVAGRLEPQIDRASRAASPGSIVAAILFAPAAPSALPCATAAPPRVRMLRHLRIAPGHADDADPFSHTASLRA